MDPGVVAIVIAIIGAAASIAVAWITARSRIYVTPVISAPFTNAERRLEKRKEAPGKSHSLSAKMFRAIGWLLVLFLYLIGAFNTVIAYQMMVDKQPAYDLALVVSVVVFLVATWSALRLKRSTYSPSPQSN
jgi:ABC-type multidrug transport system fused ATPase/permease subunit